MRETCTKNTFREESAVIKFLPRSEVFSLNYDCSFKIHLPVGRKIALNISVITQQPTDQVDTHSLHTPTLQNYFFFSGGSSRLPN